MNRLRFGLPAVAALVAGVGALVFIIAGTRALGLERFAAVSQLWTVWAIAYSVVTFSVQQVVIRSVSSGAGVPWRKAAFPAVAMVAVAGPILILGRTRLFGSGDLAWPIVGTMIPLGSLLTGVARGRLAAVGDQVGLAFAVGGENFVRAVAAVGLALVGLGPAWFAGAILAGFVAAAAGLRPSPADFEPRSVDERGEGHPLLAMANSIAGLSSHTMLVVAPAVLALASLPNTTVSAVFVVLAVYRSPYQLILGVAPSLSSGLLREIPLAPVTRRHRILDRFALGALVLAVLAAGGAALFGEAVVAPIFGASGVLAPVDHALAAGLTMLAVFSISLTLIATAIDQPKVLLIVWPLAATVGIGVIAIGRFGPTAAFSTLALAELCVAVTLFFEVRRRLSSLPATAAPTVDGN